MAVNFEYYRFFYYVAKYGNMTQAAKALRNSQPNVTRIMNNLEHELGCHLLIRSNKGVTLTAAGEQLYSHVASAFEQLQLGEDEVSRNLQLQSGSIIIGASETALHIYLLSRLRHFRHKYPNIKLKILNYTTPQAMKNLRTGQIDLAVVATPTFTTSPYKEITLRPFQDILACGPRYASLALSEISLQDIIKYPLICLDKHTNTYKYFNEFFLSHHLILDPDIEVATSDLILPMIINDLGIGLLPQDLARDALADGSVYKLHLKEQIPERQICLVYDAKRELSMTAKALKDELLQ